MDALGGRSIKRVEVFAGRWTLRKTENGFWPMRDLGESVRVTPPQQAQEWSKQACSHLWRNQAFRNLNNRAVVLASTPRSNATKSFAQPRHDRIPSASRPMLHRAGSDLPMPQCRQLEGPSRQSPPTSENAWPSQLPDLKSAVPFVGVQPYRSRTVSMSTDYGLEYIIPHAASKSQDR